jgi:hypothetical protein
MTGRAASRRALAPLPPADGVAGGPRVRGQPTGRRGVCGDGLACGEAMPASVGGDGSLLLPPLDACWDVLYEGYERTSET